MAKKQIPSLLKTLPHSKDHFIDFRDHASSLWEKRYLCGDTPWDKGQAHPFLKKAFQNTLLSSPSLSAPLSVLVPGCGKAHDVEAIASLGHHVIGIDLSPSAIQAAQERLTPLSSQQKIELKTLDFFLPPKKQYDLIWEHTCFCAILPEQRSLYAQSAASHLNEQGKLLGVFFISDDKCTEPHQGPPFFAHIDEVQDSFAPFFNLLSHSPVDSTFPGRHGEERLFFFEKK